ncbi:MAG: hypothetical protein NUK57_03245 [Gudongella sp.]|nr:hypothetical protein [Gudongella sp.]
MWTWTKSGRIVRDELSGSFIIDLSGIYENDITGDYSSINIFDMNNVNYDYAFNNASVIGNDGNIQILIFAGNDSMSDFEGSIEYLTASLLEDNKIRIDCGIFAGEFVDSELFFIIIDSETEPFFNDEIYRVLIRIISDYENEEVVFEEILF